MYLSYHGGMCCGIKTIHGFKSPSQILPAAGPKELIGSTYHRLSGDGGNHWPIVYGTKRPEETREARFREYVRYCNEQWNGQLIELVLSTELVYRHVDVYGGGVGIAEPQIDIWRDIVESEGFKAVSTHWNSNSIRECTLFHLVIDKRGKGKAQTSLRAAAVAPVATPCS